MRSAPDGSCATRCHVVPPSASLRPSHAAGCRLLPRFWRRFQRPPRVGLNPARLRGIRTLAQRLGAAAITGFFAFRSVLGLIKRSIRPSRTWRAGTRRTGSVPSPRACSPCRGAWSFRSASKRRLPLRAAQTLSPEIERRDRQCDASLASRVAPTPAKPRKLRPYVIDILVQSRRNRRAAKRFIRKLLKGHGILNNIALSHRRLLQCQDPALRDSGLQILNRLQVEVLVSADAPLDEIKAKIRPSSCCWKTGAARAVSKGLELTPRS